MQLQKQYQLKLHWRLATVQESDEELISFFEEGIDNRELKETEGFVFPVLPVDLNGLVLIFHINQHLRSGLGLRQIIDWMMFMDKLPEGVWEEKMLPVLRKTGMEKLALTVTAMCQKYLGLKTIVDNIDDYPCDELMDYIMEKGNFGRKDETRNRVASFSLTSTDIKSVFRRLQTGGLTHWTSAKNHPVLRPFAWIYQSFRILGIFLKKGIKPAEVIEQQRHGMKQRELIKSLGLKIDRMID